MINDNIRKDNPKVSVVCAWYNRAEYIRDTIDSLLAQDFDSYEIVVINDGSTDPRVREILESYADSRLRVIHQENRGFTLTIRRAIEESRGEYIAIQGAGDVSYPVRLHRQFEILSNGLHYVGVGSAHENIIIGGKRNGERHISIPPFHEITHHNLMALNGSPFSHGEVMFRRSIYFEIGGYREFFRLAQDIDLWLRMSRLGDFAVCRDVLYQRRVFNSDGVAAKVNQTLAQSKYARIAKQCSREVDVYGEDTIDIFGGEAAMYRNPEPFLANLTAKAAIKYMRNERYADAKLLADLAVRERAGPLPLLAWGMIWLCDSTLGRVVVRWMIGFMSIVDERETPPILSRNNS